MKLFLDPNSAESYRTFLQIKNLPIYAIRGRMAEFPDEYAASLGLELPLAASSLYRALPGLFDYQRGVIRLALRKRKFGVFADPGLGKTLIMLEFKRHALSQLPPSRRGLMISPLMVIDQTIAEAKRFYGDSLPVEYIPAKKLAGWLAGEVGPRLAITNYDALNSLPENFDRSSLGALALDESSMLKSMYGKWGGTCIAMGKGLGWKIALTGTPAPNDRIEYGNHALFLDQVPTLNAFLSRYFVNRGQTDNRWELKPHALEPFYKALSHWSIFLTDPSVYGWRDNVRTLPPVRVHIHDLELTPEQEQIVREKTDWYETGKTGGITTRSILSSIGKGFYKGEEIAASKPGFIRELIAKEPERSTLVWCLYNHEQDRLAREIPFAASIQGSTKHVDRMRILDDFKSGRVKVLISKPDILGFGLNLQVCTRMIFSGLQDSYESYYQAIKRANRFGSTEPLDVHIPITAVERPMIETVLVKADRVMEDTRQQERIFRQAATVARELTQLH